ncbi:MAG: hypothetical protein K2L32_01270, partial [Muribaculaceae bacterium]|nr:hypothetical protein [Muribaculaceae bacterium]
CKVIPFFPFHQIFQTPKFLCFTTCFSQFITKQPVTPTFLFPTLTFINISSDQQSAKNAQKHALSNRRLTIKNSPKSTEIRPRHLFSRKFGCFLYNV